MSEKRNASELTAAIRQAKTAVDEGMPLPPATQWGAGPAHADLMSLRKIAFQAVLAELLTYEYEGS